MQQIINQIIEGLLVLIMMDIKKQEINSIYNHIHSIQKMVFQSSLQPSYLSLFTETKDTNDSFVDDHDSTLNQLGKKSQLYNYEEMQMMLSQIQKQILKTKKSNYLCLEHLINFMENFSLMAQELSFSSSLMKKSFKYSLQHICYLSGCLVQNDQQTENGFSCEKKEKNQKIQEMIEDIHSKIDECFQNKDKHIENISKVQLLKQVKSLEKKIQSYEQQRISFERLQKYYEKQIDELKNKEEDLPTFNFNVSAEQISFGDQSIYLNRSTIIPKTPRKPFLKQSFNFHKN